MTKHQARHVVFAIARLFDPSLKGKRKAHHLISASFALSQIKGSVPTILKARKALGVISRKVAGKFVWYAPVRSPQEALIHSALQKNVRLRTRMYQCLESDCHRLFELSYVQENRKKGLCPFCRSRNIALQVSSAGVKITQRVIACMKSFNYEAESKEALLVLQREWSVRRREAYAAKKLLGIKSIRENRSLCYWVYASEEVIDWLGERVLRPSPVMLSQILHEAERQKQWSFRVINLARIQFGSAIKRSYKDGKEYWHDTMNRG